MSIVFGWDIGGAHLKAARVKNGRVEAVVQVATPLWLGLGSLDAAFDAINAQLGGADHHVITMTGELCDAFSSREEGVAGLAAIAANHLDPSALSLYAGRAGFVELGKAALHAADIASANWHASAALLALRLPHALFIDIGSTTADLIPIVAGQVVDHKTVLGNKDPIRKPAPPATTTAYFSSQSHSVNKRRHSFNSLVLSIATVPTVSQTRPPARFAISAIRRVSRVSA